jgi:membrane protein implicated in regulation of membrane protease activity
MSYPNSALSAWQLAIMAVVVVACLSAWLIAVFLADREPRHDRAAAASPAEAAGTTATDATPVPTEKPEPAQEAGSRMAA